MEPTSISAAHAGTAARVPRRRKLAPPDGGWAIDPAWLMIAIEHAADAVVITDLAGTVLYVNAAFERMTERHRADVVGRRTAAVESRQPAGHYRAMAATVRAGLVWQGEFIHRRADGSHLHTDATVAPIRDATGGIVGAVAVQRDVTGERALRAQLAGQREERAELAATLQSLRAGETAGATAAAIVAAVARLPGLGGVGLWSFEPDGDASPLAAVHGDRPLPSLGPLPAARIAHLRRRALQGPWIEAWQNRADHPYNALLVEQGIRALAYVPVRSDVDTLGLLIVAGDDGAEPGLADRLPALVECASVAGALLAPQLRARHRQDLSVARIRAAIEGRAFAPVFQPIVELGSQTLVGCEALTRFADGSPPERVFTEAAACGLSIELEQATLQAALAASRALPRSVWLNVNVSAEFVLAGNPLVSLLREARAPVVLELTGHMQIADYGAVRAAIQALGPKVRLAVDDAGAGFASFRHILELQPDYVKLDRTLVHLIGRDAARQALVAGLVHFAATTGATLIAAGVETEAEARQLAALGVALGQGYHLGRPAPVGSLARRAGIGTLRRGRRPATGRPLTDDDIASGVNIGAMLAAALRTVGIATLTDLQAVGAVRAWERLRQERPHLATQTTLLKLEGASRGVRPAGLPPDERDRLMTLARIEHQQPQRARREP